MGRLITLQNEQFKHDEDCHRDILYMTYQERFKHDALHYGKYSGRLALLLEDKSPSEKIQAVVKKTLVDAFIIVLHSAELFQMDLEAYLKEKLNIERELSITELVQILKESSPDIYASLDAHDEKERLLNLMIKMTVIGGPMQKAAEELDHMIGIPRDEIRDRTANLLVILLIAGSIWNVDYEKDVRNRWEDIAKKTKFRPQ
jgi:hypothetical protein